MNVKAILAVSLASALLVVGCKKSEPTAATPPASAAASSASNAPAADPYAGWVTWDHPDGLFSVKFPAQFKLQEIDSADGEKIPQAFLFVAPNVFMAQATVFKLRDDQRFDPAKAIAGARDSMLASMEATMVSQHPIKQDGIEGVEFTYQGKMDGGPVWGKARYIASESPATVYFLQTLRMSEAEDPQVQTFLDSVHINHPEATAAD